MKFNSQKKGMSLIELIIAVAIFGIFSLMVTTMLISAARNYERGKLMGEVRRKTEMSLRYMADDVRRGFILPTLGTVDWTTGTRSSIASAILLPNPYGDINPLSVGDVGEGKSENRFIVVVPRTFDHPDATIDPVNPLPDLRIVEYIIPGNNSRNLIRRTYAVQESGNAYVGFAKNANKWLAQGNLGAALTESIIADLPGANDAMSFEVQRPLLPEGIIDGNSVVINYDRHVVNIKVSMTRYVQDNLEQPVSYEADIDAVSRVREY